MFLDELTLSIILKKHYLYLLFCIVFISCKPSISVEDDKGTVEPTEITPVDTTDQDVEEKLHMAHSDIVQKLNYFDNNWKIVVDATQATYYRIAYYQDGNIVSDSITNDYYISGVKQFNGFIKSENPDILNGKCTWYNKNWQPTKAVNFINGMIHGEVVEYYENGQPSKKVNYNNGMIYGDVDEYYENSNLKTHAFVNSSGYSGEYISYYENGNIQENRIYNYGKLNGVNKKYYKNGNIQSEARFIDDEIIGEYEEYYENGKAKAIALFQHGSQSSRIPSIDEVDDNSIYSIMTYRVGAICMDGWKSNSTGSGTCSNHGGVDYWLVK